MKVLILNGCKKEDPVVDKLYSSVIDELKNHNFDIDSNILRDLNVAPCQGCFECWVKTPGECKIDDIGRDIAKKIVQSDLIVHFTPVTFGGYSSQLKKVLDRFIPTILPFFTVRKGEIHHKQRYTKLASIIVIGLLDKSDEEHESIFKSLIQRNKLNMEAPVHEVLIHIMDQSQTEFIVQFGKLLNKVEGLA